MNAARNQEAMANALGITFDDSIPHNSGWFTPGGTQAHATLDDAVAARFQETMDRIKEQDQALNDMTARAERLALMRADMERNFSTLVDTWQRELGTFLEQRGSLLNSLATSTRGLVNEVAKQQRRA